MKELLKKLDKKYCKICIYASVTVLITVALLFVMSFSGGFWKTLWYMFAAIIKPILIGSIICYLFLPVVERIEKLLSKDPKPWTRPAAVAIFYVSVALILMGVIIALFLALQGGIASLKNLNFDEIQNFVTSLYNQYSDLLKSFEDQVNTANLPVKIGSLISAVFDGIAGFFSGLLFGVIFSVYFMLDEKKLGEYWMKTLTIINGKAGMDRILQFAREADVIFSGYLRGQFIDAIIVGVSSSIILSIAGIPYAPVIGLLVGLGNLIPYVGPVVGYGAIAVICIVMGQFDKLIIGIILMAVIMFIDGNIINPKLLSDNIEIHPLLVVAALLGGGAIGGFVGMLIAVPTAAFLKLQFDKLIANKEKLIQETADQTTD